MTFRTYPEFSTHYPLVLTTIMKRPVRMYPNEIGVVYRNPATGEYFRFTWMQWYRRVAQLANGLRGELKVQAGMPGEPGERIATMALNTHRHLELYYGVTGIGATLHPINVRLSPQHIVYTIRHAQDKILFVDDTLMPLLEGIYDQVKDVVELVVYMSDKPGLPQTRIPNLIEYETLIARQAETIEWPALHEDVNATLCYTTGTTGQPKGATFTHRQLYLLTIHMMAQLAIGNTPDHDIADGLGTRLGEGAVPLLNTPMFHIHGWGQPFVAVYSAQKIVLHGTFTVQGFCELVEREKVTSVGIVATIAAMLLEYPDLRKYDLSSLVRVSVGGGALPLGLKRKLESLIPTFRMSSGYGMTETAPTIVGSFIKKTMVHLDRDETDAVLVKSGLPILGVEVEVIDDKGKPVPQDDHTVGEIVVRAPWATGQYYRNPEKSAELWQDGWLHTGDIAKVDAEGYITIADRMKDVIRSGAEMVPTVLLENLIAMADFVHEATVVGVPDPVWGEKPLALVSVRNGFEASEDSVIDFLKVHGVETGKITRWMLPKLVAITRDIPKTSVGKYNKKQIRDDLETFLAIAKDVSHRHPDTLESTPMSAINAVADLAVEGEIAILTLNSPPVNALSAAVRAGILAGIERAIADSNVRGIVLTCAGKTFIAGADITEFGKPPVGPSLADVQAAIEGSPKPVVAAIHGTALGGGLEVALVCHYRVAARSARCGLPEVNLGLLPGAGGTQRLPRIVGPAKALDMVTSGAHIGAAAAAEMGLFDLVTEDAALRASAIAFARQVNAEQRPLRKVRDLNEKVEAARGKPELFADFRRANARKFRGFDAPEYNIRCIEAAVNLPFDEGMKVERKLFLELMNGTQSAAQRYYFFASRQVWNVPDVPADTPVIDVKKVGIIGAGTMGGGIAMNMLNAGIPVVIVETAQQALDRGVRTIRANYDNTAKKGRITAADVDRRMALLTPTLELGQLADADLVIEAVYENMDVKKDIFGKLDKIVKPGAILATNTSALDVNEIARATSRPESVIGLHFFSPANVMKLLEVVRGDKTAKPVIRTSMELARKIGKIAALVGVCPGFVGNRMLAQRQREAQKLVLEGALPWDIDRVLYNFGFPMGPFAMSDLAGLDLGWIREKSSSATLREILCEMDRRGQKTGAGYYDYDEKRNAIPSPVVEGIIRDFAARQGKTSRVVCEQEILERCIYPMINEGAKILEEGKAIRASDIDVVWVNGYGWPVYRGGPMCYADTIGLDKVLAVMKNFEATLGADFKPARLLEDLVAQGKKFSDLK